MEETALRQQKMGKYTHANCRRCWLSYASNNQHVTAMRNLKEFRERKYSDTLDQGLRQEGCAPSNEEAAVRSARNASDYGSDAQVSCTKCANFSREYRASENVRAVGKEIAYRGKRNAKSRSRSLAGERKSAPRFLTRSTSCGNVRFVDCSANDTSCSNSGTDSEPSEVFNRDDSSSADACVKCDPLERYRGISSMPSLIAGMSNNNNNNDAQAGNNQLGLEVMLSLINGPMQSVIDSKDEKIRSLEHVIERLECENKQIKLDQKPGDATKIFTLEKTLENCVRQIEQLEEANKTAQEKVGLLEDLRKNDKECIDMLRAQTSELEMKLTKSDERVREAEKDGMNQSQWLKQQYEKQIQELQGALRSKETKLRELDKAKSRVAKQKQEIEDKRSSENELHAKMCEQVLELKRDLQVHQTRLDILEREKRSLQENLSQSENLQRQDQKSSYVLQMKIVELQEKLEASHRKNEDVEKQREMLEAKMQVLEEKLNQATFKAPAKWQAVESVRREQLSNLAETDEDYGTGNRSSGSAQTSQQQTSGKNESKSESPERCATVANHHIGLDMNDVLRERVTELHKKFYKGQQTMAGMVSSDAHVQDLSGYCEEGKWQIKEDGYDQECTRKDSMDDSVPVRDTPLKKMELTFTGDKRRPSSDDSSSASSSASSSRRGSAESPRSERRQLKVLKVRKVSKENISQFQQNVAYLTSLNRQSTLKGVRESPRDCGQGLNLSSNRQTAFRQVKERSSNM